MKNIATSLESVSSMQELQTWLDGNTPVSSYIGTFGGRRFQKEGCSDSIALKGLIQKTDYLFAKISSTQEQRDFFKIVEKIQGLDRLSNQQLENSNCFQRILTKIRQFFGSREYDWCKVFSTMQYLSTALWRLNTELRGERIEIRKFVQKNIKEMVAGFLENRKVTKAVWTKDKQLENGEAKLKFRVTENTPSIYLRLPWEEGATKFVEQKIYLLGPRAGSFAYSKPRGEAKEEKEFNRDKIKKECKHSRTISVGNVTNVIKMEGVYSRKDKTKLKGAESEWKDEGDLLDRLDKLSELDRACEEGGVHPLNDKEQRERQQEHHRMSIGIAKGVASIHRQHLVHLDMKPSNILLHKTKERILRPDICDYDRTGQEGEVATGLISIYEYSAPEIFKTGEDGGLKWVKRPSIDLWALGLILLELFQGKGKNLYLHRDRSGRLHNFVAARDFARVRALIEELQEEIVSQLDTDCVASPIIERLLDLNPDNRLPAEEVAEELEHLFNEKYH